MKARTIATLTLDDFRGLLELDKVISYLLRWRDSETGEDVEFENVERQEKEFAKGRFTPYSVCNGTYALTEKWMREKGWKMEEWAPLFRRLGANCDCQVSMNVIARMDEFVTVYHCRRCNEYRLIHNKLTKAEKERRLSITPSGHGHRWAPLRSW
jgi:hypothetical protein